MFLPFCQTCGLYPQVHGCSTEVGGVCKNRERAERLRAEQAAMKELMDIAKAPLLPAPIGVDPAAFALPPSELDAFRAMLERAGVAFEANPMVDFELGDGLHTVGLVFGDARISFDFDRAGKCFRVDAKYRYRPR